MVSDSGWNWVNFNSEQTHGFKTKRGKYSDFLWDHRTGWFIGREFIWQTWILLDTLTHAPLVRGFKLWWPWENFLLHLTISTNTVNTHSETFWRLCFQDHLPHKQTCLTGSQSLRELLPPQTPPERPTRPTRTWARRGEARKTTLASLITETIAREVTKVYPQYTTWIKENCAPTFPTTLKINSRVNGFKVMDPFDWTQDRDTF